MENCNLTEVLAAGASCNRAIWIGLVITLFVGLCGLFSFLGCYWERLKAYVRKKRWGQAENPDCSEVAVERRTEAAPPFLRVISPVNQVTCSGDYELVPDERPAGMPLWRKRGGDRWLYCGDDGRWYIGGISSKDRHFACSSGFIYHNKIHDGMLPHMLNGSWEWGGGAAWHKDPMISVSVAPVALRGTSRTMSGELTDERCGALGVIPDGCALTYDCPSPRSRARWGPRTGGPGGKRDSPSEASTDEGVLQNSVVDSSTDGSSSVNNAAQHDHLPPPVAARPQMSPWRSPGRLVQILDEPGAESHTRSALTRSQSEPPRILLVTTPSGQKDCAGEYMLVERMKPNGQPVWRQQNGEHWLYSGTTSRWCIGGQDVKDDSFNRSAGWISQTVAHNGIMPDKVRAAWQRWDSTVNQFVVDDSISVVGRPQPDLSVVI